MVTYEFHRPLAWCRFLFRDVLFSGPPATDTRPCRYSLLLLLVLPGVLLYPTRSFHLLEPDEGRYAQIPKEMLDSGSWIVPTLQGEPYLDKPPLLYWLVAISYWLGGVSPDVARLVPAVCVHLTILAVYGIGRRSLGERAALWAALLLTVAPGFMCVARLLLLDGLLTLCVTVSVLCGFEAVRTGTFQPRWWLAAALASGLGFLTKGPISEVLLFVPLWMFAYLAGSSAVRTTLTPNGTNPSPPTATDSGIEHPPTNSTPNRSNPVPVNPPLVWYMIFLAVVLAVNVPWYVAIYLHQPHFLKYFFWEHNVLRFLQPFDHLQPVWYYAPILVGGLFPGTIFLAVYVWQLLRGELSGRPSLAGGFWLLAGGWCVVFFSCSGSKLPTYILPAYPFLCLAIGEFMARTRWNTAFGPRGLIGAMAAIVGFAHFVAIPWYAQERSPVGKPELLERYVTDPNVPVVCFPRNCDSVAFYFNRSDLKSVRTKNINQLMVDCHHRPQTVILFTHRDSLAGFRNTLPPSLKIVATATLKRKGRGGLLEKLTGSTPWGLCDIAVVVPLYQVPPPPTDGAE
ncbi:MAG: glycosyltransferase family 39 protein [Gemmataceae bacterium]|nr:glycosyltransferase family 39 protein [Gemmata sp.]MDW8197653.1 glycosyltransferase family 39 protein [Gemmataceae bacterium]